MVFYYVITNYHILNCILHKLKYNKNKKTVLYVSEWHPEYLKMVKNIKKANFFDDVFVLREVIFPSGNNKIGMKKIKDEIDYITVETDKKNNIDFSNYDEINIWGDHYGLGVYLNNKGIKYNYFEDGSGLLSNPSLLMNNLKKVEYSHYQILKYLKLPGGSSNVLNRYGDLNAQLSDYYDKKDIHFSAKEELQKVSKVVLKRMISVFDNSFVVEDFSNYDIILTFHYNNFGLLTLDEQRLFYSYLIDFFGHDKIVIKPHPSDVQADYKKWFPTLKILPRKLPSEFLPLLVESNFNSAITGWSTSVNGLRDKVNSIVNFDQQIDYKYKILLKYYMISKLIVNLLNEEYSIICYGFSINYVKNFIDNFKNSTNYQYFNCNDVDEIMNINGKKVVIFDKVTSELSEYINNFDSSTIVFEIEDISDTILKNEHLIFAVIEKKIIDKNKYRFSSILNYDSFSCMIKDSYLREKFLSSVQKKDLKFANIETKLTFVADKNNYIINKLKEELAKSEKSFLQYKEKSLKQISNLESEFNELSGYVSKKEKEILELKHEIDRILNSNSWKMTKWYRDFGNIAKKIIHRSK